MSNKDLKNTRITFRLTRKERKKIEELKEELGAKTISEAIRIIIMKVVGDKDGN